LNFGLDKQIERLVEVLAASALLRANRLDEQAFRKLRDHAFPEKVAEKINLQQRHIENWDGAGHEVCDDL